MNYSILLIDDNIDFTMSVKEYLSSEGITVNKIISKTDEALEEVKNKNYDIIIIDMELNGNMYAGLEIIKSIKNRENIGFIVVTGHNEANLMLDTLNCGILRYLIKPFDLSLLHAHILHLIESRNHSLLEKQGQRILSVQQEIILKKLSQGFKSALIANEMGISIYTIKYHKKVILKILDTSTINQAISIAIKTGLIT